MPSLSQVKSAVKGLSRFNAPSSISSSTASHLKKLGVDTSGFKIQLSPSGEPISEYPKGFRFLSTPDQEIEKQMKENTEVQTALKELHRLESNIKGDHMGAYKYERFWTQEEKDSYEQTMQVQRDIIQNVQDNYVAEQSNALEQVLKAINILPEASAEQPLSETRDIVTSMPRVPGQTISERGAGESVPIAEQQPQTDIFGNVIPAYEPPSTISGTRGQIRYEDPSINSGLRSNPLSVIGETVYGTLQDVFTPIAETVQQTIVDPIAETLGIPPTTENVPPPTEEPIQQIPPELEPVNVTPSCPARVQIVSNLTNVVAGEGLFDCSTIERYENNPDYRIVYLNGQEAIPTEAPEPEQEQLAPILQCADVYRWENGNVSKSSGQFTLSQIQGYISQGLMIRDCNTTRPTDQQVKDHYGIISTADIPPPEMPTEEPPTDIIIPPQQPTDQPTTENVPPLVTISPIQPTNFGLAGILLAGVFAIPILAGLK